MKGYVFFLKNEGIVVKKFEDRSSNEEIWNRIRCVIERKKRVLPLSRSRGLREEERKQDSAISAKCEAPAVFSQKE